ncbi:hypothetical protein GCM10027020_31590 [Nocardioides salsibiostraticola]
MIESLNGWRLAALALVLFAALCTAFALLSESQFELFSHFVLIVGIGLMTLRFLIRGKKDS